MITICKGSAKAILEYLLFANASHVDRLSNDAAGEGVVDPPHS